MGAPATLADQIGSKIICIPPGRFCTAILTTFLVGASIILGITAAGAQDINKVSVPSPSAVSIAGIWRGYYYYNDGKPSVRFRFQFQDENGHCGHSDEPQTFGAGECGTLHATLDCDTSQLRPGKKIVILKKYDGCGRQMHGVRYEGIVSPDLQQITGEWEIMLYKGTFLIRR